jgi:sarcosine oxidase gamma subunit
MDEFSDRLLPVEESGVRISLEPDIHMASLRYFDVSGAFSVAMGAIIGVRFPEKLCAIAVPQHGDAKRMILAWRSPTETFLLCDDSSVIRRLEAEAEILNDGCVVDQTGGALVLRVSGKCVAGLFARMGGQATLPNLGEARRSRLADVPVLALQVQADEILLVVQRVYAEHLMMWIRVSVTYGFGTADRRSPTTTSFLGIAGDGLSMTHPSKRNP